MLTYPCVRSGGLALVLLCVGVAEAAAALLHRFSFNDGAARDSAGRVTATLHGDGATISGGQLVLKNEGWPPREKISFLAFDAPILPRSGHTVSLVVWFTANNVGEFARVINFGASEGTEGTHFIYFSPRTNEGLARVAITGSDVGAKTNLDPNALDDGKPHMLAIVIDGAARQLRVFVDGREPLAPAHLGANTLDKVRPVENWLGKSSFAADPGFTGAIDELRVYDHALSAPEIVAAFQAGPDTLPPPAP